MPTVHPRRRSFLVMLSLALLGADANQSSDVAESLTVVKSSPLEQLHGVWKVVDFQPGGEKAVGRIFTFRGEDLFWRNAEDEKDHVQFKIKLGHDGKLATFDMSRESGGRQIHASGVYRLDADALEIHYSWNKTRPTSLSRPPGGFTFKLKRVQ